MPPKRPTRPPISPLLKALRLWDRRARRGVLPPAALLAEWQTSVDAAVREGSTEAPEQRLRLASIGVLVFGRGGPEVGTQDSGRRERDVGRLWQAVFDAPRRGTVGKLADRVAGQLSGLRHNRLLGDQHRLARSTILAPPNTLQTTLTDEADDRILRSQDFILARQVLTSGWLDRFGVFSRFGFQVGGYSNLDMPFVLDTELELDWVEGEPDPFDVPEVIGPARQMAERLVAKGARVQVTRGREVPVDAYEPGEARAAEELSIAGAYGPVSLGSLSVLDQAVPLEERPGLLHLILAPGAVEAAKSLPVVEVEGTTADLSPGDRPNDAHEPGAPTLDVTSGATGTPDEPGVRALAQRDLSPEFPSPSPSVTGGFQVARPYPAEGGPPTLVQIAVDWVSGEDPWRDPEMIAQATASLQARAGRSARVEIVRGREVPFERYAPSEARASADLVLLGPSRPVPLTGVALLDGAVVELQRPGRLQVLLAPVVQRASGGRAVHPEDTAREYPELVLAREEVDAADVEGGRPDVDGERRFVWTADLGRREVAGTTRTAVEVPASRGGPESPRPTFGLVGAQSFAEQILGIGQTRAMTGEREPISSQPQAPAMRVIDRQAELRRAERAREAEVFDDTGLELTAPSVPVELAATVGAETLARAPAAPLPPLALPLVVENDGDLLQEGISDRDAGPAPGNVIDRPQSGAATQPAPIAAQPSSQGPRVEETASPSEPDRAPSYQDPVEREVSAAEPAQGSSHASTPTDAAAGVPISPADGASIERKSETPRAVSAAPTDGVVLPTSGESDSDVPKTPPASAESSPAPSSPASMLAPDEILPLARSEAVQQERPAEREAAPTEAAQPEGLTQRVAETTEPDARAEASVGRPTGGDLPTPLDTSSSSEPEAAPTWRPTGETIRITLDWIGGEDPWADPRRLEQAREAIRGLEDQGVRVELVRGREVPPGQYDPREAQRAADFQMLTAAGPVFLEGLNLLDSAMLVAQRPGALEVLLAPRELAPGHVGEQYRGSPEMPLAIPEEDAVGEADAASGDGTTVPVRREVAPQVTTSQPGAMPERAPAATQHDADTPTSPPSQGVMTHPTPGETIRITLDWVSGEDPWADPRRFEQAREAVRGLEDQGVRVELVRGREVPAGQYRPGEAQRAADFQMLTAAGPILLAGMDLLDAAVLVAQRPGALEVLLAPRDLIPAQPGEPYRGAPEMPLAIPEDEPEGEAEAVGERETASPIRRELAPEVSAPGPVSASEQSPTEAPEAPGALPAAQPAISSVPALSSPIKRSSQDAPAADRPTGLTPVEAAPDVPREQPSPAVRVTRTEEPVDRGLPAGDREISWLDLTVARSARRTQVVEITLDWLPGADPWAEPEQLEAARESARMLEDEGIRVVLRRGRELPAASFDIGRSLQPIDFSVVGPSGPVLLESLALLAGANLISQRPGALEVVLAPSVASSRLERAIELPELVYSREAEIPGELGEEQSGQSLSSPGLYRTRQTTASRPADAAATSTPADAVATSTSQTVQVVVDWVAGENPWSGLAERTAELVQRLGQQGIRLEFVAGRPVSPAEYAVAPAQAADAFFLPTDRGAVSLGDVSWLNQAVLRRQRPGLMHVLLAPTALQTERRSDQRTLPELVFQSPEDAEQTGEAGPTPIVARRSESPSSTSPMTASPSPFVVPSTPLGIPPREPLGPTSLPAARTDSQLGFSPTAPPTPHAGAAQTGASTPDFERVRFPSREWLASPQETSEEADGSDAGLPDVQVAARRSSPAARRAHQGRDLARPLATPGEFAAEVVQRTEDGIAPVTGAGAEVPRVGDLGMGENAAWSTGAGVRSLWDNTPSMSVLVYDITSVEGESDTRGQAGSRFGDWSSAPPIGSAMTYVHESRPAEMGRELGPERVGGYVIPSTLIYVSDGELMTAEPRQAARAAADRQPVSAGSSVQRVETELTAPTTGGAAPQAPNLEVLAREVYREIKWRLVVEHERAGTRRPTRGW